MMHQLTDQEADEALDLFETILAVRPGLDPLPHLSTIITAYVVMGRTLGFDLTHLTSVLVHTYNTELEEAAGHAALFRH